jgi:hypothetical protein
MALSGVGKNRVQAGKDNIGKYRFTAQILRTRKQRIKVFEGNFNLRFV